MSLKKLSLLLLVAGLFVNSFAILLVVDEDGLGMDFATIGDALETAEKGDTIIITKKHTGDWHEDIVIDKGLTIITQDLTIKNYGTITINTADTVIIDSLKNIGNLTYTDGAGGGALLISDLLLTGSVTYNAKGENGLIQISNSSTNAITANAATSGGNVVRVLSSSTSTITAPVNYKLELYNSRATQVNYADGDIIGNTVYAINVQANGVGEITKIVGNLITNFNSSKNAISHFNPDMDINILNNKFTANASSSSSQRYYSKANGQQNTSSYSTYTYSYKVYFYDGNTTSLIANRSKSVGPKQWVYDTTYTHGLGTGSKMIAINSGNNGVARIEHNFFNNTVGGGVGVDANLGATGKVLFNQNAFDNPSAANFYTYMVRVSGGFSTANYNFGDKAGYYNTSGIIDHKGNNGNNTTYTDAGNPDPFYNDIDGTRCDVSYEGGAYPYSTFDRAGRIADATLRKPLVMWVEAPRKIRPGQKIEIKATGIAF